MTRAGARPGTGADPWTPAPRRGSGPPAARPAGRPAPYASAPAPSPPWRWSRHRGRGLRLAAARRRRLRARAHAQDAPWLFAALLPLLLAVVVATIADTGLDAKAIAMLGVLAAAGAALRPLGAGTAGIEPMFFLMVLRAGCSGPASASCWARWRCSRRRC